MLDSKRFIFGFVLAAFISAVVYFLPFKLLSRVGELSIDPVIAAQMKNEKSLFSSGLDQNAYRYKFKLMEAVRPEVVAIGSSRAMQVRKQFFKSDFVNLGGAVSNIAELESVVSDISSEKQKPRLALVFIDPWWLNKKAAGNGGVASQKKKSNAFSLPLALSAIKSLKNGNWISKSMVSSNLGIHAILTGEGFAQDGSYHYTNRLSGRSQSFDDQMFKNTLARIEKGEKRFAKADFSDPILLSRTCTALRKLKSSLEHVVVIAPPFASVVWKAMAKGGYGYVLDAYDKIEECVGAELFHSFVTGENIPGTSDCEFIDGFHGGDVTYARMISLVATSDDVVKRIVDWNYVNQFIYKNSGLAGATTRQIFSIDEVDFLEIGCEKKVFHTIGDRPSDAKK
jgi:hypothetical protein